MTETFQFPRNLSQLTLEACRLDCDPMPILEKLPKLLTLRAGSYLGKEMHVSANGFPQLKILQLLGLSGLVMLNIEKGAMPWLMQLCFHLTTEIFGLHELLNFVDVRILSTPARVLLYPFIYWLSNYFRIAGTKGGIHIRRQEGKP